MLAPFPKETSVELVLNVVLFLITLFCIPFCISLTWWCNNWLIHKGVILYTIYKVTLFIGSQRFYAKSHSFQTSLNLTNCNLFTLFFMNKGNNMINQCICEIEMYACNIYLTLYPSPSIFSNSWFQKTATSQFIFSPSDLTCHCDPIV